MTLSIKDRIHLDIRIDGQEIPTSQHLVHSVALVEGNGNPFPSALLVLRDHSGHLSDELNLVDGNSITITAGLNADSVQTVTRQYRVFGTKQGVGSNGPILQVCCIYDAPAYITANVRESKKGPSDKVLEQVALDCKLTFDGPGKEMKDAQTWLNVCKSRMAFAHEVSRHGYMDEYSAMAINLTSLGVLKYKNLSQAIEDEAKYTIFHNAALDPNATGGRTYISFQAKGASSAGLVNNWQNYGSEQSSQSLKGTHKVENKVDVKTSGSFLAINEEVSKTVGKARVSVTKLDCSNTHDQFDRAYYQNVRLLSLFCERMSVLIPAPTDIQLFDTVVYRQSNNDISKAAEPTDKYIVMGKTVFVKGKNYAERIELCRMSVTNKGASKMTTSSQDPNTLKDSVIPAGIVNAAINIASGTFPTVQIVKQLFSAVSPILGSSFPAVARLADALNSPGLMNVVDQVMSGNPDISAILKEMPGVNQALSDAIQMGSSYSNMVGQAALGLSGILNEVSQLPTELLQTVQRSGILSGSLFGDQSVLNVLAVALPTIQTLVQSGDVHQALNTVLKSLPQVQGNPCLDVLNTNINQLAGVQTELSLATNSAWNSCISLATGQALPNNLQDFRSNSSLLNALSSAALEPNPNILYKAMPLDTTVAAMADLLSREGKSIPWVYPHSVLGTSSVGTLSELANTINTSSTQLTAILQERLL